MKCTITINMDNAAFESGPGYELSRILAKLEREIFMDGVQDGDESTLKDYNGNTVGKMEIS